MWLVTAMLDSADLDSCPNQAALSVPYHDRLMDTATKCAYSSETMDIMPSVFKPFIPI